MRRGCDAGVGVLRRGRGPRGFHDAGTRTEGGTYAGTGRQGRKRTLFTFGFWGLVWLAIELIGGEKRESVTIDEFGNVQAQRI